MSDAPQCVLKRSSMGCVATCHLANRIFSFHGIADDAVRLLLPLFEGWTCSSIAQVLSLRTVSPAHRTSQRRLPPLPPARMWEWQVIQDQLFFFCRDWRHQTVAAQEQVDDALRSMDASMDVCHINQRHLTGFLFARDFLTFPLDESFAHDCFRFWKSRNSSSRLGRRLWFSHPRSCRFHLCQVPCVFSNGASAAPCVPHAGLPQQLPTSVSGEILSPLPNVSHDAFSVPNLIAETPTSGTLI